MTKHLCLRPIAVIAGAALLAPACAERVVDMDRPKPVVNVEATKGAADDIVVVLNEQVVELRTDGTRLYWTSQFPCAVSSTMALRSCVTEQCASTLVTYATSSIECAGGTPVDTEDTASDIEGGILTGTFATDGENVYWGASCGVFAAGFGQRFCSNVLACPVSGCENEPSVVLRDRLTTEHVMAQQLHWLSAYNPVGLQRCDPARCAETVETVAVFDDEPDATVKELTLDSTHAYWIAGSSIRRVALDGQSPVETIDPSSTNPTGLTITDRDIFWANAFFPGTITGCAIAGCGIGEPKVIVAGQTYPSWTAVIGSSLFWTSASGFGDESELRRCNLADCSGSIESIEPAADVVQGHWDEGDTLYFGTSTDGGATTAVHRRRF